MKRLPNGAIELSLVLGNLEEIERWILSWGTHAEVLGERRVDDSDRAGKQWGKRRFIALAELLSPTAEKRSVNLAALFSLT